jgi:hypothetical protein
MYQRHNAFPHLCLACILVLHHASLHCRDLSFCGHVWSISHDLILAPTAMWPSSRFHTFTIFMFFMLWHALLCTSLGSIAFHSHVLCLSSKVHWCVFCFVSLTLYHICLCISIYVHLSRYLFILHHPWMFSTTYLVLSPGDSLSMLTCQHIGRFLLTSLPSPAH